MGLDRAASDHIRVGGLTDKGTESKRAGKAPVVEEIRKLGVKPAEGRSTVESENTHVSEGPGTFHQRPDLGGEPLPEHHGDAVVDHEGPGEAVGQFPHRPDADRTV
ncbi:hypothetical protein [Streptomyces sp. NPDC048295]|uniref:hypothetical protein n=1 Tax=Streptomyces sp. NPDC048295 TaxID=3154617 RepID=UPI00343A0544